MNELDRELAALLQVDPSAALAARVRVRVSAEAPPRRVSWTRFAAVGFACAVIAMIAVTWPLPDAGSTPGLPAPTLAHGSIAVLAPLRVPVPRHERRGDAAPAARSVIVSQAEMAALRRLFSGELVAPPALEGAGQVSIPALTVDEILVPDIPGGGEQ